MYNYLKYKHDWKKCVHCGSKTKKIDKEYRQCVSCEGQVSKYFMRRIPRKRRYNPYYRLKRIYNCLRGRE